MLRIAVFILSIIGVFYIVFQWTVPEFRAISENKEAHDEAQEELADIQNKVNTVSTLDEAMNRESESVDIANTYLPIKSREDRILNVLSQSGRNSGIYIYGLTSSGVISTEDRRSRRVVVDDAEAPNELQEEYIEVELRAVGSYESARQFFSNLISIERRVDFVEVIVGRSDEILVRENEEGEEEAVVDVTTGEQLSMSTVMRFVSAETSPANTETILADFGNRSVDIVTEVQKVDPMFPLGGLEDLEYEDGGRENPFFSTEEEVAPEPEPEPETI